MGGQMHIFFITGNFKPHDGANSFFVYTAQSAVLIQQLQC